LKLFNGLRKFGTFISSIYDALIQSPILSPGRLEKRFNTAGSTESVQFCTDAERPRASLQRFIDSIAPYVFGRKENDLLPITRDQREESMHVQWRDFLFIMTVASTAATAALAQEETRSSRSQGPASIPDFSGIWSNRYFGVDPPISGPGPVMSRLGIRGQIVGDYTNPILKPHAAEAVKKLAEMELSGVAPSNPRNQCWPEGLPFIFINPAIMMIQQPTNVTIFYEHDHQVRHVYLNRAH
jgi:hypothetical protein